MGNQNIKAEQQTIIDSILNGNYDKVISIINQYGPKILYFYFDNDSIKNCTIEKYFNNLQYKFTKDHSKSLAKYETIKNALFGIDPDGADIDKIYVADYTTIPIFLAHLLVIHKIFSHNVIPFDYSHNVFYNKSSIDDLLDLYNMVIKIINKKQNRPRICCKSYDYLSLYDINNNNISHFLLLTNDPSLYNPFMQKTCNIYESNYKNKYEYDHKLLAQKFNTNFIDVDAKYNKAISGSKNIEYIPMNIV